MKFYITPENIRQLANILEVYDSKDSSAKIYLKLESDNNGLGTLSLSEHSNTSYLNSTVSVFGVENLDKSSLTWEVDGSGLKVIFSTLMKGLGNIEINLDNHQLNFLTDSKNIHLKYTANPIIYQEDEYVELGHVHTKDFIQTLKAIRKYTHEVDVDSMRVVFIKLTDSAVEFTATDKMVFVYNTINFESIANEDVLIHLSKPQIAKLLSQITDDTLTLIKTDTRFGYKTANGIYLVSTTNIDFDITEKRKAFQAFVDDSQYFDIETHVFKTEVEDLMKLASANITGNGYVADVKIVAHNNMLELTNHNNDKFSTSIKMLDESKTIQFAIKEKFLIQLFSALNYPNTRVYITKKEEAVILANVSVSKDSEGEPIHTPIETPFLLAVTTKTKKDNA